MARPVCAEPSLGVTYRLPDSTEVTVPVHLAFFQQGSPALPDGTPGGPEWFLCGQDPRVGEAVVIPANLIVRLGDWDG